MLDNDKETGKRTGSTLGEKMKLEHQVCTLEEAKKFDELGLKLESYFVWVQQVAAPTVKDEKWKIVTRQRWKTKFWTETIYPAFSCAEVGGLLPEYIYYGTIRKDGTYSHISYLEIDRQINKYKFLYMNVIMGFIQDHEAHAKSDLLIRLFKEGHINPAELSW